MLPHIVLGATCVFARAPPRPQAVLRFQSYVWRQCSLRRLRAWHGRLEICSGALALGRAAEEAGAPAAEQVKRSEFTSGVPKPAETPGGAPTAAAATEPWAGSGWAARRGAEQRETEAGQGMPASRALGSLPPPLLLLLLLPGAAAAAAGCPALRSKAEFDAYSASNLPLRKAVFLSKLGKSSLCDKLLAKYAGRLDLAVVGKDSPDLAARLAVDEWPALRVLPRGGGMGAAGSQEGGGKVVRYEGGFRFGAFDAIGAWLEEQGFVAAAPPPTPPPAPPPEDKQGEQAKRSDNAFQICVVGAGPAGLQLGFFLQQARRDYVILEREGSAGAFFKKYPRHRQLISINKVTPPAVSRPFYAIFPRRLPGFVAATLPRVGGRGVGPALHGPRAGRAAAHRRVRTTARLE